MYRTEAAEAGGVAPSSQTADLKAEIRPLDMHLARDQQEGYRHQAATVTRATKRLLDVVAASLFFVVFLPLLVIVAVGVWRSSPGPILFVQDRIGRGGLPFRFYKFRSMAMHSDEVLSSFLDTDADARRQWEQYQKLDRDPRITPFGRFIRRTSLDELPQFWNVLRGDMSMVGPRPVTSAERRRYGIAWPAYCSVRPGLTGLWQVSGRSNVTYEQRVQMDVRYVKNQSVLFDLVILCKTFSVVLGREGSR